jgi:hypothetical protein
MSVKQVSGCMSGEESGQLRRGKFIDIEERDLTGLDRTNLFRVMKG